jgi:hypothetical protein
MTDKPSSNEEEYFLKQDAELVKQMRARLDAGELELLRKVKEHRFASLFQEIFRSLPGK